MKKITLILIGLLAFWPVFAHGETDQAKSSNQGSGSQGASCPVINQGQPMHKGGYPGMMANRTAAGNDEKVWDRMASVRFYKLTGFLNLTPEEANKLAPAVQALDTNRKEYFQARDKSLDNLAEALRKGLSGNELKKAVAGIKALDKRYQAKEASLNDKILGMLPAEKQAKYYLFNRYFSGEVRKSLYNMAERRMKGKADPRFRERIEERMKEKVRSGG